MQDDHLLNPQSVFGDGPPVARKYMGQSTFAVIMACVVSVLILPISFTLGLGATLGVFPELSESTDMLIGGIFFLVVGLIFAAIVIATFVFNKMHNYAVNIMGMVYLVGFVLGFGVITAIYLIAGPGALD